MKARKDTTASSNVNEFLSVFFLINEYKPDDFVRHRKMTHVNLVNKEQAFLILTRLVQKLQYEDFVNAR